MKYKNMEFTCNVSAMNALLASLHESELIEVMEYTSTKVIWDEMSSFYEDHNMVEQAKIQDFRMQFESLKMHDDEDIAKTIQEFMRL